MNTASPASILHVDGVPRAFHSPFTVWDALLAALPRFRAMSAPLLLALGCTLGGNNAQGATTQSFSYIGPPVPIPDGSDLTGLSPGAQVFAPLLVSGFGPTDVITKVVFRFDGDVTTDGSSTAVGLNHSFVSDLEVSLIAPDSTSVLMLDNVDGSGNNFAQMILDDAAATSVSTFTSSEAPFNGTWQPSNPLSAFNGLQPNGTWQLGVQDFYAFDTGNIRLFTVTITADTVAAVPEPSSALLLLGGLGALLVKRRRRGQ